MKILSIHFSHDGSVSYVDNNKIIFHTQLDRYNKIKHHSIPSKEILDIILNIDFDVFITTRTNSSCMAQWTDILNDETVWINKFKKITRVDYGETNHHLFHAYCALTWNKKIKNILTCDGGGSRYLNDFERESYFKYNNKLTTLFKEQRKIGKEYEIGSKEIFGVSFQEGKTLALSLHDKKANLLQFNFEKKMLNLIKEKEIKNEILFTGGCAQNVRFNSLLLNKFNKVFCDPFNGDFGISLGAINYFLDNKIKNKNIYLGIKQDLDLSIFHGYKIIKATPDDISKILLNEPVAIFQSRSEQGQRGLGNRSLLMSPLDEKANNKLNIIKKREWYRPFACSILQEESSKWFNMLNIKESPYMMYVFKLLKNKRSILKAGYAVDFTSRIQTVGKEDNINFYNLLRSFNKLTNTPILINTSLNLPGEVLVETFYDLLELFKKSNLRYIYLPEISKLIIKNETT
jgi:predicted NodU family carbamoyl transferase